MFKNMMKQAEKAITSASKPTIAVVSQKKVIEEIHETFFTEVDRLLAEAKISKSTETQYEDLLKKQERLKNLGFSQTKEMIAAQAEIARLEAINKENANKETLIKAIEYFSMKYPTYKFITEQSVKKICQKYGLIYGGIDKYKGTVPDRAIEDMERFKIEEVDEAWIKSSDFVGFRGISNERTFVSHYIGTKSTSTSGHYYHEIFYKASLEIAAPLSDFDTRGMETKDFQLCRIEVPDPIVLQPVMFNNNKYYLIVTAWGLEAKDELVFNPKMN
jgi:hypothetical protein